MAVRILYTRYARSHDKTGLSAASNVAPPSYEKSSFPASSGIALEHGVDEKDQSIIIQSAASSTESLIETIPRLNSSIAVFPQYLTKTSTTLTIREVGFPYLSDSFTVSNNNEEIFNIRRERPAIGRPQHITDSKTKDPIMTIRRNIGQLPMSYRCEDPKGAKVLDLQGNFFRPYTGAKSSAFLLNSETGEKIELSMRGSYRNRHASITNKATGKVLVEMTSDIFEGRNVLGGRRTYQVKVRAGMDLVIAVAMIVALDARAD